MKKLVKLKIITSNEEIICLLYCKNKYYYTFKNQYGLFSISVNDIEYIEEIGEVKEND